MPISDEAANIDRLLKHIRQSGGAATNRELQAVGIRSNAVYAAIAAGDPVRIGRGAYRLREMPPFGLEASFAQALLVVGSGVIALGSALAYYELTTDIPLSVDVAVSARMSRKSTELTISEFANGPMPYVRYTAWRAWLVRRSRVLDGEQNQDAYTRVCKALVKTQQYETCARTFSEGDETIDDVASGNAEKFGQALTWVRVMASHHLFYVTRQMRQIP